MGNVQTSKIFVDGLVIEARSASGKWHIGNLIQKQAILGVRSVRDKE